MVQEGSKVQEGSRKFINVQEGPRKFKNDQEGSKWLKIKIYGFRMIKSSRRFKKVLDSKRYWYNKGSINYRQLVSVFCIKNKS